MEQKIWQTLTDGKPAVLTSHVNLDGDGLGATVALWHALRQQGVQAYHIYEQPTPKVFDFLPGMAEALGPCPDLPSSYNLAVLDCGSFDRVGSVAKYLDGRAFTINIDHHLTNSFFGNINYVDRSASSCGELVYRILRRAGVPLSREIADCLFVAIVTDTGMFSYRNTTSESLDMAAELVRCGVLPYELDRKVFRAPPASQLELQGMALQTLRLEAEGRIATMKLTGEMFAKCGVGPTDTQGFADIPASIRGVEVGVLLKDVSGCDDVKVSLRSNDRVDVCEIARSFGGGGHSLASGCEVKGTIDQVEQTVVNKIREQLRELDDA